DAFVGLTFDAVKEIGDVVIKQDAGDKINKGVLEYSVDGTNWSLLATYDSVPATLTRNCKGVRAKAIRLRNTEKTEKWWKVFDVSVYEPSSETEPSIPLDKTIIKSSSMSVYSGPETKLTDGDDNSYVWYSLTNDQSVVGDYIGLDLGRVASLGKLHLVVGGNNGDHWNKYDLEYSLDGTTYTKYASYEQTVDKKIINLDLTSNNIKARYVRLINREFVKKWIQFSEFSVEESVLKGKAYTNVDALRDVKVSQTNNLTSLPQINNVTLNKDEYVGVELTRIRDLSKIVKELSGEGSPTLQTSKNEIIWESVSDVNAVNDARFVRLINLTSSPITFALNKFEVHSNEIEPISVKETNYSG
ncbi:MAG: discoidin domain-containing protein, partial [Longicatena sp.]